MSVAPPPPIPGADPAPPPFQPTALAPELPPTKTNNTSSGNVGIAACTRPPKPPAIVAVEPPAAPTASSKTDVTPAGTLYD